MKRWMWIALGAVATAGLLAHVYRPRQIPPAPEPFSLEQLRPGAQKRDHIACGQGLRQLAKMPDAPSEVLDAFVQPCCSPAPVDDWSGYAAMYCPELSRRGPHRQKVR